MFLNTYRSSPPEVFSGKDALKTCSNFTREQTAFFRNTFSKNFSGELLLYICFMYFCKKSFWANFMAEKCWRFWILNHHEERDFLGTSSFGILILRKGYNAKCFNHFYKTDIQCALYSWVLNCASENSCWIMLGISWE